MGNPLENKIIQIKKLEIYFIEMYIENKEPILNVFKNAGKILSDFLEFPKRIKNLKYIWIYAILNLR
jgi:hypothetical protein